MFVYKCDVCRKEIKKKAQQIGVVPPGKLLAFTLCEKCGKPILGFLKKHKLFEKI